MRTLILFLSLSAVALSQDIASFEKRMTVKRLANGLTVLIMERPEAPVFSFFTHVDVGGAQEVVGITGLAHMFEHMAFKGTDTIGTRNYAAERSRSRRWTRPTSPTRTETEKITGRDAAKIAAAREGVAEAMDAADKSWWRTSSARSSRARAARA